jgi:hypothetical protein
VAIDLSTGYDSHCCSPSSSLGRAASTDGTPMSMYNKRFALESRYIS